MSIWLPTSRGVVDSRVWSLNEAAREYDERLTVGRNEETGDYCVYIAMGSDQAPYPVLGLGPHIEQLPTPEGLKRRLYQADTVRHGEAILNQINRHNADLKKRLYEDPANEATGIAAEALAWGHRRMSNNIGNRVVRVYPGEKRGNKPGEWK